MKAIYIYLILILLTFKVKAQQNDFDPVDDFNQIKEEVLNFYTSLDRNNAKTDFLWNYGFIILNDLEQWYAGQPVITSLSKWLYIYNSVEASNFVDNEFLPKDSTLFDYCEQNIETAPKIALSVLYYRGEYLKVEELQRISGEENPVPNYEIMDIFAGTTLLQKSYNLNIEYNFLPELLFTNQKNTINNILIDFGDNNGYKVVNMHKSNTFNITYDCVGKKNIMFKLITDQNDTLISYSKVEILPYFDVEPDFIGRISDTNNFILFQEQVKNDSFVNNDFYYAQYMYIEGDDNELDKPIIFIEGFDILGNITLTKLYNSITGTQNDRFNIPELKQNGYDIFIVNLQAPDHNLYTNSTIIKSLIEQINSLKTSNLEGVLVGISMGGVLCRIALKRMENEGYDHQIGLFVSVDSPQKGANIAIGLQFDGEAINELTFHVPQVGGYLTDIIEEIFGIDIPYIDLYQMLNSTSAQQMLIRHHFYDFPNPVYLTTQNWLQELGYPEDSRNITSPSGSNIGVTMGIAPRSTLMDYTFILGLNNIIIRSWYPSTNSLQNMAYYLHLKFIPLIGYINVASKFYPYYIDNKALSNSPGGSIFLNGGFNWGLISLTINAQSTFIPVLSAIDIDNSIWETGNLTFLNENLPTRNAEYILVNNLTPFDDIYADYDNYQHPAQYSHLIEDMRIQEMMYKNMYIQNRIIEKNRDFEATTKITAGNNVTFLNSNNHTKYIKTGDVVIKNGATVNFKAGESIHLSQGFRVESGGTFHAYLDPNLNQKQNVNNDNTFHQHSIIGNKFFSDSTTLFTDAINYKNIIWQVIGNNFDKKFYTDHITLSNLRQGQYMVFCNILYSDTVIGVSDILKVKKDFINQTDKKISQYNNDIIIYPNPSSEFITIFIPNYDKPFDVSITSMTGEIIYTKNNHINGEQINIKNYAPGIYLLTFKSQNYVWHKKFIKN